MNKKIITLGLALGLGVTAFAQKKEIRTAERAIQNQNFQDALELVQEAEEKNILEEKDKWKVRYYIVKASAIAYTDQTFGSDLNQVERVGNYFKKALELDEGNEDAKKGLQTIRETLVRMAMQDQENENYAGSAEKMYKSYELDKTDTIHLYNAASQAVNAQQFDKALKYYQKLLELDFDGSGVNYFATNNETGEEESFGSDEQYRDVALKSGQYSDPKDVEVPSKKGEITKNISLIYIEQEKPDKAIKAIKKAKTENPDDEQLIQVEADLYYQLGEIEKYREIMEKIVEKDPNNATTYFNLGASAEELGDVEGAKKYYAKAIELDKDMVEAYLNMASAILSNEEAIVEEMNELGMSKSDQERYEELNKKRAQYYVKAIPYLEKAIELDSENLAALQTLMNIYFQTGEEEKAEKLKTKIDELKG
ncbi:MAG: tetratricopeptide repeat protein [Bacteroidota bacterium]